ncbi:MAG: hypothetical protein HY744_32625, partial [Deltaproteobacteria bacterium]|nr:hypothetical protein [Deltaproteobacteria bacterium]
MSEPANLAKSARETLSAALAALQSSDDVPDELLAVAEPIARTMGILHAVERSDGTQLERTQEALSNVRGALGALQNVGAAHPAVDAAMEAVAGSLAKLFALSRCKPAAAAPAAAKAAAPEARPVQRPAPEPEPAAPSSPETARATREWHRPRLSLEERRRIRAERRGRPSADPYPSGAPL